MSTFKQLNNFVKVNSQKIHNYIALIVAIPFFGFILFLQFYDSKIHIVPFPIIAILFGLLFEDYQITKSINEVLKKISLTTMLMCVLYLISNNDNVDFQGTNISILNVWYIIAYIWISIDLHGKRIIGKLHEGIVLVQTLSIIYWVIDIGLNKTLDGNMQFILLLGILVSFYSLFHAFTYTSLNEDNRLVLSIWSSILMLIFSVDNIYNIYSYGKFDISMSNSDKLLLFHQYFLLGVSAVYIVQNFLMLLAYFPNRGDSFRSYKERARENSDDHINRFSDKQFKISHSIMWFILVSSVYTLNYWYHWLPRNIIIGTVFIVFPMIMSLVEKSYPSDKDKLSSKFEMLNID